MEMADRSSLRKLLNGRLRALQIKLLGWNTVQHS